MTDEAKPDEHAGKKPKPTENWEEDQQERGYYYDDSHGYETYDPAEDEEGSEEGEEDTSA
jgi:hypothetical protein